MNVTFLEYTKWVDKYRLNNDVREIIFQNEVVKKLLNNSFEDLDIIDCSKKGPRSSIHDYSQYCGLYSTDKFLKIWTPDLVIAKDWNWKNIENDVDYRAVVEVKSPYLKPIYNKSFEYYSEYLKTEIECHLKSKNNTKLILTDALKWEFYCSDEQLKPVKSIELVELSEIDGWIWKKYSKTQINSELEKNEFEELKSYLRRFLVNE